MCTQRFITVIYILYKTFFLYLIVLNSLNIQHKRYSKLCDYYLKNKYIV